MHVPHLHGAEITHRDVVNPHSNVHERAEWRPRHVPRIGGIRYVDHGLAETAELVDGMVLGLGLGLGAIEVELKRSVLGVVGAVACVD